MRPGDSNGFARAVFGVRLEHVSKRKPNRLSATLMSMNRIWPWLAAIVFLLVIGGAYLISVTPFQVDQEAAVRKLVENFGSQLEDVSLMAPADQLEAAMQANYTPYVAPELLVTWLQDPVNAPGRLTSSPWPDRIEVRSITKESDTRYVVEGDIVEVTNEGGGIGEEPSETARRAVSISAEKRSADWLITSLIMHAYAGDGQWLLSSSNGQDIQFMYPVKLPTTYISAQQWPPVVERTVGGYSCNPGPVTAADGPLQTVERRTIGDREYCVTSRGEGTADGTVMAYEYAFAFGDASYRIFFQLRFLQCLNYEGTEQQACVNEQENYNLDAVIDRIAQSIQVGK